MTDIQLTTLADMQFPEINYGVTDARLEELEKRFAFGDLPDVNTDEGYDWIKDGVKELTSLRTAIETRRKDLKAPALQWGRDVDSMAKSIVARIKGIETPMRKLKEDVDEARQKAAREAAEAEAKRVKDIQDRIDEIKAMQVQIGVVTVTEYDRMIATLEGLNISEDLFAEFVDDAREARDATLYRLKEKRAERAEKEEEDRQRAAEKAELEQQRKEQEEREAELQRQQEAIDKQQREAREAEEAAEREKQEAEQRRIGEIRRKINEIKEFAEGLEDRPSADIQGLITLLQDREPLKSNDFDEFQEEAHVAWLETYAILEEAAEAAVAREEAKRAEAEARKPDRVKLEAWITDIEELVGNAPEVDSDIGKRFRENTAKGFDKVVARARDVLSKMS